MSGHLRCPVGLWRHVCRHRQYTLRDGYAIAFPRVGGLP